MNKEKQKQFHEYLKQRKQANKTNYYVESLKEIKKIQHTFTKKPRILLHACCIVCGSWPLEFLSEVFDITVIYNNSNIWPQSEHDDRLAGVRQYLHEKWNDTIQLVVLPYDYDGFMEPLRPLADEPEGFHRCFACYAKRMDQAYRYAVEHGFDYFTTVLTFSRMKDSQKINEIGASLQHRYPSVKYFFSDFKKAEGVKVSKQLSDQYGLYHQDYCGCEYSYQQRQEEKAEKQHQI